MKALGVIGGLAILVAIGCDKPPHVIGTGTGVGSAITGVSGSGGDGGRLVSSDRVQTYSIHNVQDPGNGNMVAYTYIMPAGWESQDNITWVQGKLPYPVSTLVARSPDKAYGLGVYPMIAGTWWSGPAGTGGTAYASAGDAVDKIMSKADGVSNYNVMHEDAQQAKSEWPSIQGGSGQADITMKRVSFTQDGMQKEGFIWAKLDTFSNTDPYTTSKLWHLAIRVMTAPQGQLMSNGVFLKQAATFFSTCTITPEYNALINKTAFDASQINRKIALEEDDMIMKNYWNQQKSMEKGAKDFDDYIRGRQDFKNPNGGAPLSLPSGQKWYTDGNGNLKSADDPGFDPNEDGGGKWNPLQQMNG